ncbi:MAG: hypothetical protein A3F35_01740 [Candidatus Woykebacteria bacterium RIFCSPHIGHO2_12_FULL_45_10]|uniref:Uncharacterized protein n=1 Tax=Candidatus Woykebacteria bacterium RIFCSPHIGHO2_12_FULL_45_10 TaxID=1802603 RepID=A0A1G1WTC8_9BACT|nr:MAG: hypothetical protein A3F35_01740 [Candidatus Woykebacteria bacterium RIFCSPHIGHO2_12_FULL_45_10]
MDAAQLLIILLNFLVVVLIALAIYAFVLMVEVRQSLRRTDHLLAKIEAIADFLENKIIKTGSSAALYLGLIKEFLNFASNLRTSLKKETPKVKKGD